MLKYDLRLIPNVIVDIKSYNNLLFSKFFDFLIFFFNLKFTRNSRARASAHIWHGQTVVGMHELPTSFARILAQHGPTRIH